MDENQARSTIKFLTMAGHDVLSISEIEPGASDRRVLSLARETTRILVTFDADFGDLIFQHGEPAPPAILYLRLNPIDPFTAAGFVTDALRCSVEGLLVVCTRDGERRRVFPTPSDAHRGRD